MAGSKSRVHGFLKNPRIRWGLGIGVWSLLVMTAVIPTWQGVVTRNQEIADLEDRLATMDEWTVAGMWLAPSVQERTLPVNAAFYHNFPRERRREELFYSLARVADQSGIENFGLSEINDDNLDRNDVWGDGTDMADDDDAPPVDGDDNAMDEVMTLEIPKVELGSYRVSARFFGDYQRVANFMSGLEKIERALKVHSLEIVPERDGIQVNLELDVYVSKTSQS